MNLKIKVVLGVSVCLLVFVLGAFLFPVKTASRRESAEQQGTETEEKITEEISEDETEIFSLSDSEEPTEEIGTETAEKQAEEILSSMTLEEKVAQMFVITPEALTGYQTVTAAGEATKEALQKYPVGGLIYFASNITSKEQVTEMIAMQQQYSIERTGLPLFISIDEEGGKVARIANETSIAVTHFSDMPQIGAAEDALLQAGKLGDTIGAYLKDLGFNLDFAPVADVLTNPQNTVVKQRSFGSDAEKTAELAAEVAVHLEQQGVYSCMKHFPGHGATTGDSHKGFAYTEKTLEELRQSELVPFQRGIEAGVSFLMAGHISAPNVTGDDMPATLSKYMITDILRNEMQFDGIVITDAMNMGAISNLYSSAEAAVLAVEAGVDMILMPTDFQEAYNGILNAVENGRITEERIDASALRIVEKKMERS